MSEASRDPACGRAVRVRAGLRAQGLDALVVFKPQHVMYLTGFNPIIHSHPLAVIMTVDGDERLVIPALRTSHAQRESRIQDLRLYGQWGARRGLESDVWSAVAAALREMRLAAGRIGLELDWLSVRRYEGMQRLLPDAALEAADDLLRRERMLKDEDEIANIRVAARIADLGMEAAVSAVAEGATEAEASVAAMGAMQRYWARELPDVEPVSFGSDEGGSINALWCYVLSGTRISLMCDSPRSRRAEPGEPVQIIIWTCVNGYHAENERTVVVRPLGASLGRLYDAVLEAGQAAFQALRVGVRWSDVFDAAAGVLTSAGYGSVLPGRIGHGLGLGPH